MSKTQGFPAVSTSSASMLCFLNVGPGVSNSGPLCTLLTEQSPRPCFDVPLQRSGVLKGHFNGILGFCCSFTLFNYAVLILVLS